MNVVRNEIRTGLVVLFTLTVVVGTLIYLGMPGVFSPQKQFTIYFDNAAGIKLGTPVMLAGRKVGQVTAIASPVPRSEQPEPTDGKALEARVTVRVDQSARIYNQCKVELASYSFLSEPVIDFTLLDENSGLATEGKHFVGDRPGGLANAGVQILDRIDPVVKELNETLRSLRSTADNLTKITNENADLPQAFAEVHKVATNLKEITAPDGSLRKALNAVEGLAGKDGEIRLAVAEFRKAIGPDSDLAKSLANVESFTRNLADDKNVPVAIRNLRVATEQINSTIAQLRAELSSVAQNLDQASDTLKHQPWRLIWPSTKKYPEEEMKAVRPKRVR